jgi:hypothetical protein
MHVDTQVVKKHDRVSAGCHSDRATTTNISGGDLLLDV